MPCTVLGDFLKISYFNSQTNTTWQIQWLYAADLVNTHVLTEKLYYHIDFQLHLLLLKGNTTRCCMTLWCCRNKFKRQGEGNLDLKDGQDWNQRAAPAHGPATWGAAECAWNWRLSWTLCCHCLETLNDFWIKGPLFSFCTEPHTWCRHSCRWM